MKCLASVVEETHRGEIHKVEELDFSPTVEYREEKKNDSPCIFLGFWPRHPVIKDRLSEKKTNRSLITCV